MHVELESGTPAYVVRTSGAHRGLVVIPDIWGLRPLFTDLCDTLATRTGWSVATFEPFPGRRLPGSDDPDGAARRFEVLRDIDDAAVLGDAGAAADATEATPVGLIGFCMGGMYALTASATGRFDRIVSFYGMIEVPEAWRGPGHREPLDALSERGSVGVAAIIGTLDAWTPTEHVDRLAATGVAVFRYEGADHGFVHDPSRPSHRRDDAADAWDRALSFIAGA